MTVTQVSQKEEGKPATKRDITTKAPLSERIMKKVASAVLLVGLATAPTNCGLETSGLRIDDAGQSDADADMDVDGDTDLDGGMDADADTDLDGGMDADADTDMDGGPDADADTDLDGGMDGDVDADVDAGDADAGPVVCAATFEETLTGTLVYVGTPVEVGGYLFDNLGESGGGILINIDCVDDGSALETDVYVEEGGADTVIDRPTDGKRITLRNSSSGATAANMTIIVENL